MIITIGYTKNLTDPPGGASFFQDAAGGWWMAYHGHFGLAGDRHMYVQRVSPGGSSPYLR